MAAPPTAEAIRDVNTRYHDAAAAEYDGKWGIDFHEIGAQQVLGKMRKLLGHDLPRFGRGLEIGAGTGYFSLNLLLGGQVRRATCTDISPGMIDVLDRNAGGLGLDVDAVACDAERLPFADGSFDRVFTGHFYGHLHPDERTAFVREARRVAAELVVVDSGRHGEAGDEEWQDRVLNDGSRHRVYKRWFTADGLAAELGGGEVLHAGPWFVAVRRRL